MLKGKTALAYAAGIIDGEGCIFFNKARRPDYSGCCCSPRVSVTNTNEWICRWFQMRFGGNINKHQTKTNWKPCYIWYVSGQNTLSFLQLMLPYLQLKKAQAELVIEYLEHPLLRKGAGTQKRYSEDFTAWRQAQFILMQKLNQKGVKVNETSLGIDRTSNLATSKECNPETVKPSQPN